MIALEFVTFIKGVKLPTHQSELGALGIFRDSERDFQHPENDRPSWRIMLDERWIEISIEEHVKERLGGNAEKHHVLCIPLENVASFRRLTVPEPKMKAARKTATVTTGDAA